MARAKQANRLDSVIQIAEDAERKAFADLAKCREEIEQQQTKLEDLLSYRGEYHQGMRQLGESTMPQQIQNRFSFLQKLEAAISGQQQQITAWGDQESRLHKIWMEKRVRCKALYKATEQRKAQLQREALRREQKQLDDLAVNRSPS
jgi:flagellar FliJ protein